MKLKYINGIDSYASEQSAECIKCLLRGLVEWAWDDPGRNLGGLLLVGHDERQSFTLGRGGGVWGKGGGAWLQRGRGGSGRPEGGECGVYEILEGLCRSDALGVLRLEPGKVCLLLRLLHKTHLHRVSMIRANDGCQHIEWRDDDAWALMNNHLLLRAASMRRPKNLVVVIKRLLAARLLWLA